MKTKIRTILIALTAVGLVACGGEDNGETETEPVDTIECGDNTVEEDGACEVVPAECGDNEVHDDQLGKCVRTAESYCAEGTELGPNGLCVGDEELECATNTIEDDGDCVLEFEYSCGTGTVVVGEECVPSEDICGENTEGNPAEGSPCIPTQDVCGENTVFDTGTRLCIPTSSVSCGPGTTAEDGFCLPTQSLYDELAEDPDLDLTGPESTGTITLKDDGEKFVFLGNIDAPELVDDEYVQHEDVYSFTADAGQWLRVTVFSFGLPEPGFLLTEDTTDESTFYRFSDRGLGMETTREILIPNDGDYELAVSNLPQLLGDLSAAGGDDWGYIGYVETLPSPDSEDQINILDESLSGDVLDPMNNIYAIEGLADVDELLTVFDNLPDDAHGEIQVWLDETTFLETVFIDSNAISFSPPTDDFIVIFDRSYSFGPDTTYSANFEQAISIDDEEIISEEITLDAGEYIGIFQYNPGEEALRASIHDGTDIVAETNSLGISTSESGQNSLYWYATSATTVTVELENTTGADIAAMTTNFITASGDSVDVNDGSLQEIAYGDSLSRGQRHYYEIDIDFDDLLSISIQNAAAPGLLVLSYLDGQIIEEVVNSFIFHPETMKYIAYVESQGAMGSGYTLAIQESSIFDVSETSSPGEAIPDNEPAGLEDTIAIQSCPNVTDIDMDIDITHTWRGDLEISLTSPSGEERHLKSRPGTGMFGDSSDDIIGNFNATLDPLAGEPSEVDADPISVFEGSNGSGDWTLTVRDLAGGSTGDLNSWTLNMTCEG